MDTHKGVSTTTLVALLGCIVIAIGMYILMNPQVLQREAVVPDAAAPVSEIQADVATSTQAADDTDTILWKFAEADMREGMPQTAVTVTINGTEHDGGVHTGSCSEVGASGGIDGKGLLAGELSAVQCYFAGGGEEIGVFANEGGGFDIMVGELSEGDAENVGFRGDFKVRKTILIEAASQ